MINPRNMTGPELILYLQGKDFEIKDSKRTRLKPRWRRCMT